VLTGAGMAVFQAADAFELITGKAAEPERMFADFDDLIAREAELGAG
jgi:shikimate dehydrogenase